MNQETKVFENSQTKQFNCKACSKTFNCDDIVVARGNTTRYLHSLFHLTKCPFCHSINNIDQVNLDEIYQDYPVFKRKLDYFSRPGFKKILKSLEKCQMKKSDRILDVGAGNGIFIKFLNDQGYHNVIGFDPYTPDYQLVPQGKFDVIIANDVIEHVENPLQFILEYKDLLKPEGLFYIGTACADYVNLKNIAPYLMLLHQPFHRFIFSRSRFQEIIKEAELDIIYYRDRSYMDTFFPFANYRFLDEFNRHLDFNMDKAFAPISPMFFIKHFTLFFYAYFGWFFPSAHEPNLIAKIRK